MNSKLNTKYELITAIAARRKVDNELSHLKPSERIKTAQSIERKREIEKLFTTAVRTLSELMHCRTFRRWVNHVVSNSASSFKEFKQDTLEQGPLCTCIHFRKKKHGDVIAPHEQPLNVFISPALAYSQDKEKHLSVRIIRQGCANDGLTRYFLAVVEQVSELPGGTPMFQYGDLYVDAAIDKELLLLAQPKSAIERVCRIGNYDTFDPNL